MRRKDREVIEINEIENIIKECKVCRLGFNDQNGIYIVPLNFGYEMDENFLTLYFHGSKEGRKADILTSNEANRVGFEMDCNHQLKEGKVACEYSYKYASIIGQGISSIITDAEEKKKALKLLMLQETNKSFEFDEKMLDSVMIFKVISYDFSVKQNK